MIITIIYLIISFLLDGLMSNSGSFALTNPSYFTTIYTVIGIVVTYHYFENSKKYLYLLISFGILFDIVYANTFLINIIVFVVIYLVCRIIDYYINNNIITINIKTVIAITMYHILTFFILLLNSYNRYSIKLLAIIIVRSIIMTLIYTTISYLVLEKLFSLRHDKKIR